MKFGKLADVSKVDFSLPPDSESTNALLQKLPAPSQAQTLYVGCTGWSMKEWNGKVYPKSTKTKDYLRYYSEQFNTIELNTTHYRIPNSETITKWNQESTSDFHFCPKIPQTISHSSDLGYSKKDIFTFCESIQGLGEKLGHSFMQLPPYSGIDRKALLENFLEKFPNHIPLSIEFRHESWFQNPTAFQAALASLEQKGMATVITDVAGRRDVLHMCLTSDTAVIRFVGNGLIPSDFDRIDDWIKRMKTWFGKGLQRIYFFTHEPDNILAPDLADYLVQKSKEHLNVVTRGPDLKKHSGGDQISLF